MMRDAKEDRALLYDSELEATYSNIKLLIDIIEEYGKEMATFEEDVFEKIIQETTISEDGTIEFKVLGGLKFAERL